MAASQPGIELHQYSQRAGDENQQQQAGYHTLNSSGIDPSHTTMGSATTTYGTDDHNNHAAYEHVRTWSPKALYTTAENEVPSWPFQENNQPKSAKNQAPLMNPPQPSHLRHILRHWCLEILTLFVSIGLLAAIIILLCVYDGKTMPEWPLSINLNTVISLLSTFLRAAMLAAVAEIIGQVKWTWFTERTRPLHHLQDFDSASRSMIGSLRLLAIVLWNYGWTSAGLLGMAAAMVTIASLAVGPFTQQALKTAMCPVLLPNVTASVPAANYVPGMSSYYRIGAGMYEIEVDMKSAMIEGLTYPNGKDNDVEASCASSNCTWEDHGTGVTYATIGLCSACLDTTDYVSGPDSLGNLTLPDDEAWINYNTGQYMWAGYSNLTWASSLFSEDFATAASVAITNFSMILATTSSCTLDQNSGFYDCPHNVSTSSYYGGLGDYIAASCTLYPCMKEYHGRYTGGKFDERIVRTQTALPNKQETTEYTLYYNYTALRSPCILDDSAHLNGSNITDNMLKSETWYTPSNMSRAPHIPGRTWANISLEDPLSGAMHNSSVPNTCLYKMDGIYASAMSNFLSDTLFSGKCRYDNEQAGHINCGDSWWLPPLWNQMNATFDTLNAALGDFSAAVTNKLRSTGSGPDYMLGEDPTAATVLGLVFENSTCTYFDWRWVLMPVFLVLICAFLLAWTLFKNYRDPDQPVWKGSVLPLIFLGLHAPGVASQGQQRSMSKLDRTQTFIRENGRSAPELALIKEDAERLWVRFHGGTDPGFMELGTGREYNDAEASMACLLAEAARGKMATPSPETGFQSGGRARSSTIM